MKQAVAIFTATLILTFNSAFAAQILLRYHPGSTLFTQGSGKTISSAAACNDPDISRILGKSGMSRGRLLGSGMTGFLDGYYRFQVADSLAAACIDSLSALPTVKAVTFDGSIEPIYGSKRTPLDYWYNHTFRWEAGWHHSGCDSSTYMPTPHFRQWFLPRAGYDRAWTVTTGDPANVIAIIDSSFDITHPDLNELWAWNLAESGAAANDSIDNDDNGFIDDFLGWDFGNFKRDPNDSTIIDYGDNVIKPDLRWFELEGCNRPWECYDANGDSISERGQDNPFGATRHGMQMASIIAAKTSDDSTMIDPDDPRTGIAGINWHTKLLPIKIGNQTEYRADVPDSLWSAMLEALDYVVLRKQQGLNIIALNMSLQFDEGGYIRSRAPDWFAEKFWEMRYIHGILPIGGAGNSPYYPENPNIVPPGYPPGGYRGYPVYPCRDPNVFCAGCVGYYDQHISYSQYGEAEGEDPPYPMENIDLSAYGAENGKCGIIRGFYSSGCEYDNELPHDGLPQYPEMMVASTESTHRVGWSVCGDVDCDEGVYCHRGVYGVDDSDLTTPGTQTHVYGPSAFMTSGATAQLSGLAGLVAAAFPDFGPDEIEAKIIAAADNIDAANPDIDPGDLGAGVTNAWKSVTRWGPLAAGDLWAGDVWISGDITVPAGMELTIAAGTTVHVAFDDVLATGPDPAHTEIIVDGTLTCLGTQAAPVTFRIIGDDPTHEWGPIVVRGTGGTPSVRLEHCVFEDMTSFLTVDLQSGDADIHISGCEVFTSGDGLWFEPAHSGSSLTLLNTSLTGTGQTLSVGVNISSGGVINPTVVLDGLTIDDYFRGLFCDSGDQTTINDVDVLRAESQGAVLAATQGTQPVLNGPFRVHDAGDFGIVVLGGITGVRHVDVLSSDGYGIFQVSPDPVAYDDVSVDDTQFAGIYLDSPAAGTVITNSYIVNSGSDGIRAVAGSLEIGAGAQIHTPGQIGVNADGADIVIHDTVISYCEGGAQASNNGSLVIDDTIFSHCYFGVSAQTTATADLSAGGSYFGPISGFFIMNGNQNETIQAQYNCFEGIIPPMGRKFIGLGPIIYTPSTCP